MFNKFVRIFFVVFVGLTLFLPVFVFAGKTEGGDINNFDIQPRTISSTNPKVVATIGIKIYPNEFISFCGNKPNVSYGLFLDAPGVGDRATASWTVIPTANQVFEKTINVPLTSVSAGGWYVLLYCGTALQTANDVWLSGGQMSKTENIDVQVYSQSDFTFGCVAPNGIYDCDPSASATCSNMNNRCNGKCTKIQPKSLCSKPATTIVMGCVASDGKYACSNGTAGNCSDVPACAGKSCIQINPPSLCGTSGGTPGTTQKYSFEITNPLKGGASDFTSLVKIIAQWIFNLAIPIAVAMIVYAGILFLTAAGEPAKVTKAKDVLKYAVIGLAIILIGSGFVTLIQSILELGSPTP
ncbi:MAG: pilin [Patescibacteria group bacterium]